MTTITPAGKNMPSPSIPLIGTAPSAGKAWRMSRIFGADGRAVVLPVDHGTIMGRVPGLEDPVGTIANFIDAGVDGFLIGPGVTQRASGYFLGRTAPARLLTIDGYWRGEKAEEHVLITQIERAAALGVDAVKLLMPWDVPAPERATRSKLMAEAIAAAEPLGMPVMLEPICLTTPRPKEAEAIEADCARIAAELGADIIKVFPAADPDVMAMWCEELGVPVVILGGPSGGTAAELVATVRESMAAGVSGITIGRKVWQRPIDEAKALLGELIEVVHGTGASAS